MNRQPCPQSEKRRTHWPSRHNETDSAQPWKVSMFHEGTRAPRGLTLVLILLIPAGCGGAPAPVPPTVAGEPRPAIARQWLGRWHGPEGTWLEIAATGGAYRVTVANLDGPRTFDATSVEGGLSFVREGRAESIAATDGAGNTGHGGFAVTGQDTTAPTVHVPADKTAEATGPDGAAVTFTATADDIVDAVVTVSCTQTSGATFALGETEVTCSATDASGNTGHASFTVNVVDTTAPAMTVPGDMVVEATGPSGATVSFAAPAHDAVSGDVAATCSPASATTFALGTTTVHCSATDNAGNTAHKSFTVTVRDTTAPVLTDRKSVV